MKNYIHESCIFLGECKIGQNVKILPYCVIEDSVIEDNCTIGPFAHIRPNSLLKQGCKVGNFCEIKNSTIGENTAISHMSYVGDCDIGKDCNIGAGTIFCNFDGEKKHRCKVGDRCFIGSNSTIIAPRIIGNDCFIAGNSTIRTNMQDNEFFIIKQKETIKKNKKIKEGNK